ncbi:LOW QUALITY PROTEIN: hypothetical protein HZS_383 [Henneguya salminicola]|nr:LOW QUALITY PROTEIN: hypothetical protein HZS_383 [Henneguya salminicola]
MKMMDKLTTDPKILLESLKSDKSLFFEIDEEKMKIRRSKDIPIPALSFRKYLDKKKANIFYIYFKH